MELVLVIQEVAAKLYQKKILVRYPPNIKACQNHLRFTLGPKKYMKMLVKKVSGNHLRNHLSECLSVSARP